MKRGFELSAALRAEAADVAREDRAALMLSAPDEIDRLLSELSAYQFNRRVLEIAVNNANRKEG